MILVQAAPGGAEEGAARMAVVLKINPGFDASYPWRQIGTGTQLAAASPLEYYLAPADKGGEPAGRWAGRGLAALGFTAGQVIDRAVFEPLYGEHLDPRDPTGKTRLGRAAQQFTGEEAIFRELAAAEPHASPARLAELRTLAKAQTRHAVPFWDITVSVSKSITLFYGGLLAAAEQARRAGDTARAEHLERRAGRAWAAIMEGNRAALEYLQDEAGMTRTGYHRGSGTESGAELGKWEHARDWVIGSFRQHTSRDGDPQLHVHNLVLNKVADGAGRQVAQAGLQVAVPVPGRRRRHRRRGDRDRADQGLRGGVGAAGGRARAGDRRDQPGTDGRVLLPAADHHPRGPQGGRRAGS